MKHILVVSMLLVGLFPASALASQRSASDELLALEQYRFNESEDISKSKNIYRSGRMSWKILHLSWEIIKDLKENRDARIAPR